MNITHLYSLLTILTVECLKPGSVQATDACQDMEASLQCYSDNWESLQCFFLDSGAPCIRNVSMKVNHHLLTETKTESKNQRIFRTNEETSFLQCEKYLEVKIVSECCNFSKTIDGFSIVKPGPMHLLKVIPGITEALIYVERPDMLHCYSSMLSLDYKLSIRGDIEEHYITVENKTENTDEIKITVLKAFQSYEVSIKSKPALTKNERLWSTPLNFSMQTLPTVPFSPKSSMSAFMVTDFLNSSRLVTFYWRKQSEDEKNGPNFRYIIDNSEETTAPYKEKIIDESKDIVFNISTMNDVGYSEAVFTMAVPSEEERQKLAEVNQSILIDNYGQFMVIWNYKENLPTNTIVTIFWCARSSDRHCGNGIKWKERTVDENKFAIPQDQGFINYAFTSITQDNRTKGMNIVPCRLSLAHNEVSVNLRLLKSSSKSFTFSLETDICSGFEAKDLIFRKVNLEYCQLSNEGCLEDVVVSAKSSEIKITNLKSATCYSFKYVIETTFNSSLVSKSNETFCTAPVSPPVILSAGHLTNQTIIIRTLPVSLDHPIPLSCIFIIGSNTFHTACEEVTIIQHQIINWQECLRVAAAFSTMGGQSRWSRYYGIKRIPGKPVIKSVKKSHNLLTGSDKKVEIKFTSWEAKYCEIKVVDELIKEPGLISQPGPSCQEGSQGMGWTNRESYKGARSCCGERMLESYFLLDLELSHTRCPEYSFSVRCYNAIELSEDTEGQLRQGLNKSKLHRELDALGYRNQHYDVFLISQWSETMKTDFECKKVIGSSQMTAIGAGISIVTAIIVLAVISAVFYVFRIKSRFSGMSSFHLEPVIPLSQTSGPPVFSHYASPDIFASSTPVNNQDYELPPIYVQQTLPFDTTSFSPITSNPTFSPEEGFQYNFIQPFSHYQNIGRTRTITSGTTESVYTPIAALTAEEEVTEELSDCGSDD